jgi:hypothetical protein
MDREGKETEKADRHRRVVEENERRAQERKRESFQTLESLRGIPREIWLAYNWCSSPKDFVEIINAKELHVARISERDLMKETLNYRVERWAEKA